MALTLSIKSVRHLEYTEEIYRTEFPYSGHVGKKSAGWKEYCAEYCLKRKKKTRKAWIGVLAAAIELKQC